MIKSREELEERGIEVDLSGPGGNAFSLLALANRLAKVCDFDSEKIREEMKEGDYEHLLEVFERYFGDFVTLYR